MELISIDELLTPDSSRHWPLEEYAHIKNLTSSSSRINRLREVTRSLGHLHCPHEACMRPVVTSLLWHDAWWKTAPCWLPTTMSSCFSWCTLLFPWKSRNTKAKSEVSNEYQILLCKLLDNYLRQNLLENELALVSTTKECTTVGDRVTETNYKAAVRGLVLFILPSLDTHHDLRPGTAWKWTSSDRLGNEGMYLCGGYNFQCGGERIDSYSLDSCPLSDAHLNPGIVW